MATIDPTLAARTRLRRRARGFFTLTERAHFLTATIPALVRLMRPRQWAKNLFVLAGLVFGEREVGGERVQTLFMHDTVIRALIAFVAFSLLSGAVYVLNDLRDVEQDRLHPVKRSRPLAAGEVSPWLATVTGLVLLLAGLAVSWHLSLGMVRVAAVYLALNLVYTYWWKHVVLLDIFCVASGFVLRVIAGVVAVQAITGPWILACTLFLSLLISLGKRRSEVILLGNGATGHRRTLGHYPLPFLDVLIILTSAMTVLAYALFTIESKRTIWLTATVPFVLYGVFRYLYLLYVVRSTESPEALILKDRPLLISGVLWAILAASLFAMHSPVP